MLTPRFGEHGFARIGGRLVKEPLDLEMRQPVIVLMGSRLDWLLACSAHYMNGHAVDQLAMQHVRQKHWKPQLPGDLKMYTAICATCTRCEPSAMDQSMGQPPAERATPGRTLDAVGVESGGPYKLNRVEMLGKEIYRVIA